MILFIVFFVFVNLFGKKERKNSEICCFFIKFANIKKQKKCQRKKKMC